jgi:hypothetical protein
MCHSTLYSHFKYYYRLFLYHVSHSQQNLLIHWLSLEYCYIALYTNITSPEMPKFRNTIYRDTVLNSTINLSCLRSSVVHIAAMLEMEGYVKSKACELHLSFNGDIPGVQSTG